MSKSTGFSKRVEAWEVGPKNSKTTILKVAVRSADGRFHGSTNFVTKAKVGRTTLA